MNGIERYPEKERLFVRSPPQLNHIWGWDKLGQLMENLEELSVNS
ncbi:MAG: hypothetical protein PUP91_36725 [Rhizonema sp. PD37]|nr:hypothetical protein [Rhizonema sp. PD37]